MAEEYVYAACTVGPAGKPCDGGSDAGNKVSGTVTFKQPVSGGPTQIEFDIGGLTPGLHGFHIHEKADFSQGCKSAGGHYNPHGKRHGDLNEEESHAGMYCCKFALCMPCACSWCGGGRVCVVPVCRSL